MRQTMQFERHGIAQSFDDQKSNQQNFRHSQGIFNEKPNIDFDPQKIIKAEIATSPDSFSRSLTSQQVSRIRDTKRTYDPNKTSSWETLHQQKMNSLMANNAKHSNKKENNVFYVPKQDTERVTRGFEARNLVKVPDFLKSQLEPISATLTMNDFNASAEYDFLTTDRISRNMKTYGIDNIAFSEERGSLKVSE